MDSELVIVTCRLLSPQLDRAGSLQIRGMTYLHPVRPTAPGCMQHSSHRSHQQEGAPLSFLSSGGAFLSRMAATATSGSYPIPVGPGKGSGYFGFAQPVNVPYVSCILYAYRIRIVYARFPLTLPGMKGQSGGICDQVSLFVNYLTPKMPRPYYR